MYTKCVQMLHKIAAEWNTPTIGRQQKFAWIIMHNFSAMILLLILLINAGSSEYQKSLTI